MSDSTRESITKAAHKLFGEKGYDATSIREIAQLSGVNIAAVNYHFGSKSGLFETLIKEFVEEKLAPVTSALAPAASMEEFRFRLSLFMESFISLGLAHQDVNRMIHRNIDLFAKLFPQTFCDSFLKIHRKMVQFLEEAQAAQVIRDDLDPIILAKLCFGSLVDLIRTDDLSCQFTGLSIQDENFRKQYIEISVQCFLNGVGVKDA